MRLRYLHLADYPPIKDMAVRFASGSPLQRECAIRFVVGINGSGKSNLLRALAEVFLALVEQRVPQFPVSLVYELGVRGSSSHRTLLLHCPGNRSDSSLWVYERFKFDDDNRAEVFEAELEHLLAHKKPALPGFVPLIAPGDWSARAATPPLIALPNAVLAYTTGAMQPWQTLWNRSQDAEGVNLVSQGEDYTSADERPAGWSMAQESASQAASGAGESPFAASADDESASLEPSTPQDLFRRPMLLTPALLKCALLAVALPQAFIETADYPNRAEVDAAMAKLRKRDKNALQELLERGGWHHLVSIAFRSRLQPRTWSRTLCEEAYDWLLCAGEVIAEPHPSELRRILFFDLKGSFSGQDITTLGSVSVLGTCTTQAEALWALLGGHKSSAFDLFSKLVELHQAGLFDDVELRLRRHDKPEESTDFDENDKDVGVLRFEELSDGEQMVLGRMALFHLLGDQQDALLLLDEPETHFNDLWKREIIDIIDDAIGHTANDVLISTHSAIVLSDVFNDEIVMVEKSADGSTARTVDEQTFATDPSALMMTVFGADDSIGKRAQEFIERKLEQATGTPADIQQLEQLIARMGSGFYRSELRTLLNTWRGGNA